jgi:predicted RNase H-like HicB family nuclease
MRRFLIVIEKSKDGFGAYSPDLPGCVAVGSTRDEVEEKIYEAISLHIEGMLEDGLPIPKSESSAEYMAVSVPA